MSSWVETLIKMLCVLVICAIVFLIVMFMAAPLFTKDTVTATVLDKSVYTTTSCSKNSCSSTTHYMIYTDKEPIDISDSFILWVVGAPQKYGNVEIGHSYEFKVYGWYIPYIQMFRSGYEITEVKV